MVGRLLHHGTADVLRLLDGTREAVLCGTRSVAVAMAATLLAPERVSRLRRHCACRVQA